MGRFGARGATVGLALVLGLVAAGLAGVDAEGAREQRPEAASRTKPCGGERPARLTGGRYECTFTEDFSGTTLDSTKWLPQQTALTGVPVADGGCYVDSAEHVSVGDGAAHLTARLAPEPFTCASPYGDFTARFTAAALTTAHRFTQTYGRFEVRARFPRSTVSGLHTALWLYPARHTYGAWPRSGEIDVAEWWSARPGYVVPSVHYEGEPAPFSSGVCRVADPAQWHRYAVEWTPTVMRFLYDGVECFRHAWRPAAPLVAPQPFDQPFYVVLTQAYGREWNAPVAGTPPVATLDVDWVRVWR